MPTERVCIITDWLHEDIAGNLCEWRKAVEKIQAGD